MVVKFIPMSEGLISVEELRRVVSEEALEAYRFYRVGVRDDTEQLKSELLNRLKFHLSDYILIRIRGELAGFYCFYCENGRMMLNDMYIYPEYSSTGIAKLALERCISSTELPVCAKLYDMDVFSISLFKEAGFRRTEQISGSASLWIYDNTDPF